MPQSSLPQQNRPRLIEIKGVLPVIVDRAGGFESAAPAMKAGAVDFIDKPCKDEALIGAIEPAVYQDRPRRRHPRGGGSYPRSGNIGLGALLLPRGERIEIDQLRIVLFGIAMESSAAMNVHQGLHPPGIQIVDMLMPQRDR